MKGAFVLVDGAEVCFEVCFAVVVVEDTAFAGFEADGSEDFCFLFEAVVETGAGATETFSA